MGLGPWPSCGLTGCTAPALFKWETVEDERPISVFLCFFHITEIRECLNTIASVRKEERAALLEQENPSADGRAGHTEPRGLPETDL